MGIYVIISILASAGFFAFALGFNRIGDGIYIMVNHWKTLCAASLCLLLAFSCITLGKGSIGQNFDSLSWHISNAIGKKHPTTIIAECKTFVMNKMDSSASILEPSPQLSASVDMPEQYWDRCARVFGQNYWKYDITINGISAGIRLCEQYHTDSYRSPHVDAWCNTVFSKTKQQEQPPTVRKI